MTNAVPDWLRGLWKRLSIETADGQRDTQTQVFYLQTSSCFGDLRLPSDRPDLKQANFSSLTRDDAFALSRQQGFAGIAQFDQGQCQWVRYIDYQPPQLVRDIGLLYWQNDILIEKGVDQVYREEWYKVDDGAGDYTALVLEEESTSHRAVTWQASLVIAGDYFIYSHNRPVALPSAEMLTDCLTSLVTLQNQQDYLSCEISFGLCWSGSFPWQIQRSTIPWREGTALWLPSDLVVNLENQRVLQTIHQGDAVKPRRWRIQEWGTGKAFKV
ncbi:hypothetical protein H6F93_08805 [Leptolyngbya sp. FACHB-671]|uniref:hypothetical protein n=1 Tax=Leptolyngbya sp. FACHB-671 TaxID=2692812 RepID=UPI0016829347|nr:hypothetical protein [Leptolyngbya sp. FACHB-671]MBD2067629.1 hypothetical protein [Leptolyngbya sp. FACHB-671]